MSDDFSYSASYIVVSGNKTADFTLIIWEIREG